MLPAVASESMVNFSALAESSSMLRAFIGQK